MEGDATSCKYARLKIRRSRPTSYTSSVALHSRGAARLRKQK